MTITTVFDPPLPTDSLSVFNTKSFDTVSKYNQWADEANATAAGVNADAAAASASAADADASEAAAHASELASMANAQAAAASAGAAAWVSGTTYSVGDARWAPSDGRVYRRRTAGAGTTDPSLDPTNWAPIAPNGLQLATVATTTATVLANTDTVFTNAAQCAATVPAVAVGDAVVVRFENGRRDNTIDLGARSVKGANGVVLTGVITHNSTTPLALRWWGDYYRSF